jgi:hypothetical protein
LAASQAMHFHVQRAEGVGTWVKGIKNAELFINFLASARWATNRYDDTRNQISDLIHDYQLISTLSIDANSAKD